MMNFETTGSVTFHMSDGSPEDSRNATARGHSDHGGFVSVTLTDENGSEVKAFLCLTLARELHDDLASAITKAAGKPELDLEGFAKDAAAELGLAADECEVEDIVGRLVEKVAEEVGSP